MIQEEVPNSTRETETRPWAPPVRRPVAERPRAPHPPGRNRTHSRSPIGSLLTSVTQPFQYTALGAMLRRRLRRSCDLRSLEVSLGRGGPGLHGMRVAMLSDLHLGFYFSGSEFEELAREISAWSPDIICFAGDLIDHDCTELDLLRPGLAALKAQNAVVAVPGNHEYTAERDLRRFREVLDQAGVELLLNRGMRVRRGGDSLWIAGVDDLTAGEPDLEAALRGLREEEPALLLSHHPDMFCESAYSGVDLTLSGHTHGGQITWFGRPLVPPSHFTQSGYWQGQHQTEGAQLLVGRGVGAVVLPIRIFAAPEVLLIELQT